MRRPSRPGLSLVIVACAHISLSGQNLELIGHEKPFSVAGGFSLNQIYHGSQGTQRRDPFSMYATGQITLALYGWSVPLSFNVSNRQTSFSQPFQQYSIHPSYRGITVHAGYHAMSFSPFTLNGHIFLGVGIDFAQHGKWKVSALYGRFLKATPYDSLRYPSILPSYKRIGYGAKVSFGKSSNVAHLIIFHAADRPHTMVHLPPDSLLRPEENLVLSLGLEKEFLKNILLKAEFAASALSRDSRSETTRSNHPLGHTGIFTPTLSTSFFHALKTSIDYKLHSARIGIGYERVDPQYRTLGAYYFNNDLEHITVNGSVSASQGRLHIAGSGGIQQNNLDQTKLSTMRRAVGSLHANWMVSSQFNFSGSFSSFSTFTHIRPLFQEVNVLTPFDRMDTLNFTQLSRNASISGTWRLPAAGSRRHQIDLHITFQEASDKQGKNAQYSGTNFYNMNTSYTLNIVPLQTNLSLSFQGTVNKGGMQEMRMGGPGAAITRAFNGRKVRLTASSAYTRSYSVSKLVQAVIHVRVNGAVVVRRKHNLNLSAVMYARQHKTEAADETLREITGTLGYAYTFGTNTNKHIRD